MLGMVPFTAFRVTVLLALLLLAPGLAAQQQQPGPRTVVQSAGRTANAGWARLFSAPKEFFGYSEVLRQLTAKG